MAPDRLARGHALVLVAVATAALLLGVAVYLTDRDPTHVAWLPNAWSLSSHADWGPIGEWLPSFVHPFAFSLFTAAALSWGAAPPYAACACWSGIDVLFEMGQHESVRSVLVPRWLALTGDGAAARFVSNYFVRGSFDMADVLAALAGGAAAALLLWQLERQRNLRHGF